MCVTSHPFEIPTLYKKLLRWIEDQNKKTVQYPEDDYQQYFISVDELHSQYVSYLSSLTNTGGNNGNTGNNDNDGNDGNDDNDDNDDVSWISIHMMKAILGYLHTIGRIVKVDNYTLCTDPTIIPKIVANFISP